MWCGTMKECRSLRHWSCAKGDHARLESLTRSSSRGLISTTAHTSSGGARSRSRSRTTARPHDRDAQRLERLQRSRKVENALRAGRDHGDRMVGEGGEVRGDVACIPSVEATSVALVPTGPRRGGAGSTTWRWSGYARRNGRRSRRDRW